MLVAMDIVLKTGFAKIDHKIDFQPQTMNKGVNLCKAGHVINVEEWRRDGISYLIKARVIRQASISETPYETKLFVSLVFKF